MIGGYHWEFEIFRSASGQSFHVILLRSPNSSRARCRRGESDWASPAPWVPRTMTRCASRFEILRRRPPTALATRTRGTSTTSTANLSAQTRALGEYLVLEAVASRISSSENQRTTYKSTRIGVWLETSKVRHTHGLWTLIDYRWVHSRFSLSASCVRMSLSSSETGVNYGIRSWNKHLSEWAPCQKSTVGIYFKK